MMASKPALYGEMCTKPAGCCPLSTCCLPVAAWALIDMAFGIPLRALGCGKWVGCGQYHCRASHASRLSTRPRQGPEAALATSSDTLPRRRTDCPTCSRT